MVTFFHSETNIYSSFALNLTWFSGTIRQLTVTVTQP